MDDKKKTSIPSKSSMVPCSPGAARSPVSPGLQAGHPGLRFPSGQPWEAFGEVQANSPPLSGRTNLGGIKLPGLATRKCRGQERGLGVTVLRRHRRFSM